MKKRVLFVGVHNKPGMQPLDSRTRTGKIIDRIISNLRSVECVKSNIYDSLHVPENCTDPIHFETWGQRVDFMPGNVIVLLGAIVQHAYGDTQWPAIKCKHPATRGLDIKKYVEDITFRIKESLKQ